MLSVRAVEQPTGTEHKMAKNGWKLNREYQVAFGPKREIVGLANQIRPTTMAKNGRSRCFLAKNGYTLKTIAAESVVGRI